MSHGVQTKREPANEPKPAVKAAKKKSAKPRGWDEEDEWRPKEESETPEVLKQDLLNIGFSVSSSKKLSQNFQKLIRENQSLFEQKMRKVPVYDYEEAPAQAAKKHSIRSEYEYLMDNEEIPDWFVDDKTEGEGLGFDFGKTVARSEGIKPAPKTSKTRAQTDAEIEFRSNKKSEVEFLSMSPEEVDRQFEEFAKLQAQHLNQEYEELEDEVIQPDNFRKENAVTSTNNSTRQKENEQRGVRDHARLPAKAAAENPKTKIATSTNDASNSQNPQFKSDDWFAPIYADFAVELKKKVQQAFQSRERHSIHRLSVNGFTQSAMDGYLSASYNIFSFYMKGEVFNKVWLYKDHLNNIQGPFMSFDMDMWNAEGNYFSPDLMICLNNSAFFPISAYINRDDKILEIFKIEKTQQKSLAENLFSKPPEIKISSSNQVTKSEQSNSSNQTPGSFPESSKKEFSSSQAKPVNQPQNNVLENVKPQQHSNRGQNHAKHSYHNRRKQEFDYIPKEVKPMAESQSTPQSAKEPGSLGDDDITANLKKMLGLF